MINNLFDKLISDLREKHINIISTSGELEIAEKKCLGFIGKLEKNLNEEQKHLLLAIEELQEDINLIEANYLYRVGIYDGMDLYRNIKNCGLNSEYSFQRVSASNRAIDAFNEFTKVKGREVNCDSEMYELITFIFDKGYQVGMFNGKHDVGM